MNFYQSKDMLYTNIDLIADCLKLAYDVMHMICEYTVAF